MILVALALLSAQAEATTPVTAEDYRGRWARGEMSMRAPGAAEAFEAASRQARGVELLVRSEPNEYSAYPFATVSVVGAFEDPQEVWSLYSY